MKYRPTPEDKRIIRACAMKSAGQRRIKLEPGERYNLNSPHPGPGFGSINIALVSDEPNWNDTDLNETYDWSRFTRGVELTDDGRGIFDFYVYSLGHYGELETNVTAYYEGRKLVRIDGTGDGTMWRAK